MHQPCTVQYACQRLDEVVLACDDNYPATVTVVTSLWELIGEGVLLHQAVITS